MNPNYVLNHVISLISGGNLVDAEISLIRFLELNPSNSDGYRFLGIIHSLKKEYYKALDSFGVALKLEPRNGIIHSNIGNVYQELGQFDNAITAYKKSIELFPNYYEAYNNLGNAFLKIKDYEKAIECYQSLLNNKSGYPFLREVLLQTKMTICAWDDYDDSVANLEFLIQSGEMNVSAAFALMAVTDSPKIIHMAAKNYVNNAYPSSAGPRLADKYHSKIRIGYFSSDFREHPVAFLAAEFFELHDRNHFETYAFSFGGFSRDSMKNRLSKAFDHFIEVDNETDFEIAQLARDLRIDIAIDLNGHTQGSRTGIFAHRAAPLQINYLGYPGTMGAKFIDYIIADNTVIPRDLRAFYSEKIIYLPHSYQVNDSRKVISSRVPTRKEMNLPDDGFVFCCFNNNYKITPNVFNGWMRILNQVPKSVLWLLEDNEHAAANLRLEAKKRGVTSERLIFANRVALSDHLARQTLADLFVDTYPYNAHTTASDALWSGLPVLTRLGESFASRVAASLLRAVGLDELVTYSQDEYENMAVELASSPEKICSLKEKLTLNKKTAPLFDTTRSTKYIESAYKQIFCLYKKNLSPKHIFVDQ